MGLLLFVLSVSDKSVKFLSAQRFLS